MAAPADIEKKAAVLADVATGMTPAAAARKHGINRSTALRWSKDIAPVLQPVATQKTENKGAAISEQLLDFVSESITTLRSQIVFARDERWLKRQSASQLAVLHGVIADKTTRLLAAIQQAGRDDAGT